MDQGKALAAAMQARTDRYVRRMYMFAFACGAVTTIFGGLFLLVASK